MATLLNPSSLLLHTKPFLPTHLQLTPPPTLRVNSLTHHLPSSSSSTRPPRDIKAAALDSDYSPKRSSSNEPRETIMLPGCDYNHWLIVMEFPKDPAPTREQMIETYLNTLATVLGRCDFLLSGFLLFSWKICKIWNFVGKCWILMRFVVGLLCFVWKCWKFLFFIFLRELFFLVLFYTCICFWLSAYVCFTRNV